MGERGFDHDEDLAAANAAEFSDDGDDILLSSLAEDIAGSAEDAEEAALLCRDLANAEDLDASQLARLTRLVEDATGWELPDTGEAF
jgi:hypothetical protein